ncbi:Hpt domain-containing protein [Thauera linaloolentis]|uniref:Chemotaxis protein CheA n=1 Tax=Thauera linaloolentis (strain DSM 12138 / JCM 21573 / CCUG 41526 / CIP 105981 / IAM 15112 / NBRC 102519 / 47Lol) TaxID=1123367 RepID=N6Z4C0_THAL4|nr:Hpt domain-containing protein [Thauera linaloolentis]ENO89407.1 response regulator receiver:CheW-like protein:ATP-binding region, ATPase-like:Hpt [Thauera linaloolentis 47Lol = DSM 12138]MCM8564369.1 Hpt domain-containing protein [Thauera linaloolentis]
MTQATETDLGPLTWVKGEIDAALQRSADALAEARSAGDAAGRVQFAQTHLHQVRGALSIIGLNGLTQFADTAEQFLGQMSRGELPTGADSLALASRAVASIGNYLEEIAHGAPDQPLRLAPLYEEIAAARGLPLPCAADLFHPDLSRRPPRRDTPPAALDAATTQSTLRQARARFERGLLDWLRGNAGTGAQAMRDAISTVEALQAAPTQRSLWWAALAFYDGLIDGSLPVDTALKRLCAQIDAQFRRLLGGTPSTPDRLLRDILYRVATMPARSAQQQAVRACWQLDALLPPDDAGVSDIPLGPLLRTLQQSLEGVRAQWDEFSSGIAIALAGFDERLALLVPAARPLGRPATRRLLDGLQAVAQWLRRDPLQHTDALALEVATALLLLEADFGQHVPDAGLAAQMDQRLSRLQALQRGETPAAEISAAGLDGARENQEKQALAQLCREMRTSLSQIEQTLDDYFRNQAKHEPLAHLHQPLQQIVGALSLLGETRALELVRDAGSRIASLASAPSEADGSAFETLAHQLSALGFYLEALPLGTADLDDLLHPERRRERDVAKAADADEAIASSTPAATPPSAPEAASAAIAQQNGIDLPAPSAADLDARSGHEEPASEAPPPAPTAPESAADDLAGDELEDLGMLEDLPPLLPTPAPAVPPPALPGSDADIDAELLCIFIEEATEVLATVGEQLELVRSEPRQLEHLTTIRRGFHTLKGSGRMVGLTALGEAAWGLEQTLNRWLQLDWPPTPALLHLIDAAHQLFAAWVDALQSSDGAAPDASTLLAEAERLRNSETAIVEPAGIEPPAAALLPPALGAMPPEPAPEDGSWPEFPDLDLSENGEILPLPLESGIAAGAEPALDGIDFDLEEPFPETDPLEALETALPEPAAAPPEALDATPTGEVPQAPAAGDEDETVPDEAPAADVVRIGDSEISPALFALYQAEARQHLGTLGQEIERLAQHPDTPPTEVALRAAHTLAGISGTAHLQPPHELARALEHALGRLRDQGKGATGDEVALLRDTSHTLQRMLAEIAAHTLPARAQAQVAALEACGHAYSMPAQPAIETTAEAPASPSTEATVPPDALITPPPPPRASAEAPATSLVPPPQDELDQQLLPIFLEEAGELFGTLHATLRAWQAAPDAQQHPATLARLLHSLKGSARMAGAMTLGSHLHELESRLEDGLADKIDTQALTDDLILGLDLAEQMIDGLAGLPPDLPAAPQADLAPATGTAAAATAIAAEAGEAEPSASATLRVRAEQVDRFVNQAGEIGISRTRIEGELRTLRRSLLDLTENVIRLRNQLREVEIQADVQMQSRIAQAESHHGEFDPLEMDRYTRLQELTRMMAESVNDVTTVQQTLLHNLDGADIALNGQARTTRELQQGLMRVRMLPFDSLADRLYRVVRQSAKELGKRATLDLRGGRIEIDRSVLEQMAAPLEHLLRNAVAHGIELPQDRSAAGKPETGQIVLTATQEGNEIAIELSDDGRGLDFERIAERARTSGLIAADEHPDTKRLTNLIFVSGFSTAGQLSAVSGRGVGMDVVKSQTAAVGGRIDVSSQTGQGTRVLIYLPLTLAVTQALLVRACGRTWAIPSNLVAQATELKLDALRQVQAERGTDWQGEHYAYRYLPRLLGDRDTQPEAQRYNWLLLLRAGAQTLALHVDGLRGNQEIVVKNAGPQLARIIGMAGATVLADGEIALILNPVALASRSLDSATGEDEPGTPAEAPAEALRQPTVMVVDDSLTVRRVTGRLLEREGYRVITAKDGVDALEQLVDILPDVVLSDIEMPRMDGFDLVRNLRADARTRAVPVIMITSRLADKHRRYAEEIGANHYLGKPYQEEELLALLAGYTQARAEPA